MDTTPNAAVVEELTKRGFVSTDKNEFVGKVQTATNGAFTFRIKVTANFPAELPHIYIAQEELPRTIAHVEDAGKVCIANSTGLLLDRNNPVGIVVESIDRALKVLDDGLAGRSDPDFSAEIQAYWNRRASAKALSIVEPGSVSERIVIVGLKTTEDIPNQRTLLFSSSTPQASDWLSRYGSVITRSIPAFHVALQSPFASEFVTEQQLQTGLFLAELKDRSSGGDWNLFERWLRSITLPAFVLISVPASEGRAVVAVELQSPDPKSQGGQFTFRTGQIRAIRQVADSPGINRIQIDRFDRSFLLPRGGASAALTSKTIVVVGCGAVGASIAFALAKSGVGALKLVDPQLLTNENVHRHLLGVPDVGHFKAQQTALFLSTALPHLSIEYKNEEIHSLLRAGDEFLNCDAMVVAVGDETIGMDLNEKLRDRFPIVYAWNDPMGLGGHILNTFPGQSGCYECIFPRDSFTGALYNAASFVAPNQLVTKSFAGCAGVFVPFSVIDASRTALECASVCVTVLLGRTTVPTLTSWFGCTESFVSAGFQLSRRAALFTLGELKHETAFAMPACSICGGKE